MLKTGRKNLGTKFQSGKKTWIVAVHKDYVVLKVVLV